MDKKLLADLKKMVAATLKFPAGRLDENEDLGNLGVDSIFMMRFIKQISDRFGIELSPARVATVDTLAALSSLILADYPEELTKHYHPAVAGPAEPRVAEGLDEDPQSRGETFWQEVLRRLSEKYAVDLTTSLPRATGEEQIIRVLKDRFRGQMLSYYGARDRLPATTQEPRVDEAVASNRGARPGATTEDIAIIGLSVRFPHAPDAGTFWQNLLQRKSAIGEVPSSRWDWRQVYREEREPGKTISKWGAFIEGHDRFDALFFKISPKEAALIDPQERLILEESYRALEDAGFDVGALAGSKTGVFVGFEFTEYADYLQAMDAQPHVSPPTYNLANRISYSFDFCGPSEAININCASSAVAVNRSFYSLLNRECDLALAGGVCLHLLPQSYVAADPFLSPDGSCGVFDERANGFTRGEGCGVVVLKRLADAQRDGDQIYALIKACYQNNRGFSKSMSEINGEALTDVIRTCYERANVDPANVRYIEVDGYCTKWGDAIEYESIKKVFTTADGERRAGKTCGLGSLKGNIGHLEPASGIAGVIKIALSMRHRQFPATVTFEEVNEFIDVERESHPLYLCAEARTFEELGGERGMAVKAGVNSFADSGVNVHILLEEYPQPTEARAAPEPEGEQSRHLVVLSARNMERLADSATRLLDFLHKTPHEELDLGNLAYTLQVGRRAMAARLAMVVAHGAGLEEGLKRFLASGPEGHLDGSVFVGHEGRQASTLMHLLGGEVEEKLISLMIAEGNLDKLALLWSQGGTLPWARLHAGKGRKKISLPGYPFEARRCWWDGTGDGTGAQLEPSRLRHDGAATGHDLQDLLTRLIAETVDIPADEIKGDTPLPDLGLHSLALMGVGRALEEELSLSLSHRELLEHTTLNAVAQLIEVKLGRQPAVAATGQYRLSEGQKGLWLLQEIEPSMSAYNLPIALKVEGEIDRGALKKACTWVLERHAQLRSVVRSDEQGIPRQYIDEDKEMPFAVSSIESLSDDEIHNLLKAAFKEPFKTEEELFIRAHLFSRSTSSHILLFTVHHIHFDGTSAVRFVEDLLSAYTAYTQGEDSIPPMAEGVASYFDFVEWERQMLQGEAARKQRAYWEKQLAFDLPRLQWLADKPRPAQQTYRGATWSAGLSPELTKSLRELAKDRGISLFVLLLALYKVLLHRYTSQGVVVVGVPTAGRPEKRFEHTVGYFVNMVAIRSAVDGSQAFTDYLEGLKWTVADGLDHASYPFPRLVQELRIKPDAGYSPVFQTTFVLQNFVAGDAERSLSRRYPGFSILSDLHPEGGFDVTLEVMEKEEQLLLNVSYNPDLYYEDTIRRLTRHYATLAESVTVKPTSPIAELDLIAPEERRMIERWNDTSREDLGGACIHEWIDAQAERRPKAVALACGEDELTYLALRQQTDRLAKYLQDLGVGPDSLVGVSMGRSIEMIVALLGVLKAGGAYVPLDPDLPDRRLIFMVEDTGLRILLTQSGLSERLQRCMSESMRIIRLDEEWEEIGKAAMKRDGLEPRVTARHLAYVAYTSGSTGAPKGVMVDHGAILNYSLAILDRIDFDSIATVGHVSTFYADLGYTALYPALVAGRTVCLAEEECLWDGERFSLFLADRSVDCIKITPSHYFSLTRDLTSPPRLKILILGGESMKKDEIESLFRDLPRTRLYNHYGPTETTVGATVWELSERTWDRRDRIGKPLANVSVHVLDAILRPVPVGIPGELCIGGRGLARGYLNRPQLTAEAFVELGVLPRQRVYRTGDQARWLPDGSIEYLGRRDLQVKIRGYRIELGEIESALAEHPGIRQVAVVGKERNRSQQLIAYYSTKDGQDTSADALREYLGERLPGYMVPAAFVALEEVPLAASGKIDRRRLAAQDVAMATNAAFASPRGGIEKRLAVLWQEILQVDEVGIHDNFFELGGDSMLAIQIFAKARRQGLELKARDIFRYQTIAELAARCERIQGEAEFLELVHLNEVKAGRPVFWLHGGLGGVEAYWVIAERAHRPFYGIQARGWMTAEEPLQGIEAMATHYTRILRSVQPQGPYDLGGYSFGGILAYEITRRLQEQGQRVASVVLIDASDVVSLRRRDRRRPSKRGSYLGAVNAALQILVKQPGDVVKTLIHRDELDGELDDEGFLAQLVTLARARGLKKTRRQIQALVEGSERIQESYQIEDFSLRPLPRPEAVRAFYLRNKSGVFLGAFEPYFPMVEGPSPSHCGAYWREWEEHLPNLRIVDIDSSSHMTMLSEAVSREEILSFCETLYGPDHEDGQEPGHEPGHEDEGRSLRERPLPVVEP